MRNWLKRNYYRLVNYNNKVKIGRGAEFDIRNQFEGLNVIGEDTLVASSFIGLGTYLSERSVIKSTRTGRYCSIGSNVQTGLGTHPSSGFVSTHPSFFSTRRQAGFTFVTENRFAEHIFAEDNYIVTIGSDVWIGNNVIIMDGVKIGDGAIVAAGAIVTKDVLPYSIVAGIPAKFLRLRFDETQIQKLLNIKWWEWHLDKLQANSHLFTDIDQFILSAEA